MTNVKQSVVAIVMPLGSQQGGAEGLLRHLLQHKRSQHTYICAFLQPGPLVEEVRAMGFATALFPTTQLRDLSNYLATVVALRRWFNRNRPVTVLSWMPKAHLYVAAAAVFTGIAVMWYQHGVPRGQLWDRVVTALPASLILCCSASSRAAQDLLSPVRQTVVCYPGVDLSNRTMTRQCAREALGLTADAPILVVVARLERWKGVHVFVKAARLLSRVFPAAQFHVIGGAHPRDLPYSKEVEEQVRSAQLGGNFLLQGQRPVAEVALWQAAADIVVQPTTGAEPFGMAVVEAMGAGTAVIASNVAGPAEIITNEVNGFLVPPDDPQAIAHAATRLLNDPDLRGRLVAAALEMSRSYSLDAFQSRIDGLLREPVHD